MEEQRVELGKGRINGGKSRRDKLRYHGKGNENTEDTEKTRTRIHLNRKYVFLTEPQDLCHRSNFFLQPRTKISPHKWAEDPSPTTLGPVTACPEPPSARPHQVSSLFNGTEACRRQQRAKTQRSFTKARKHPSHSQASKRSIKSQDFRRHALDAQPSKPELALLNVRDRDESIANASWRKKDPPTIALSWSLRG